MSDSQSKGGGIPTAMYIGIPAIIVLLAVIFIMVGRQKAPPVVFPPQQVVLGTVEAREIVEQQEYVGVIEADNIVDLRARVSGFLVAKNFQDGALVKAGQLLFQIEPDQYQAQVENAEADVLSAQAQFDRASLDFTRISDLYRKNTSPKSDYDSSKAAYEVAQAALASAKAQLTKARLDLSYAAIKAPFDGRISDSPYYEGSLLGPESGVLATVVSLDPILVTFGISDKIFTASQRGDLARQGGVDDWQVRLRLDADYYYDKTGRFTYIAPTVDPLTDTVKIKAKFENPAKLLRPGQIVTAVVERSKPDRKLLVPKSAVLTDSQGNYMLLPKEAPADPQKPEAKAGLVAEVRRVTLENSDSLDKDYVIKDGIKEGEQFISQGLMSMGATLRPGSPIQIAPPAEAAKTPGQPAAAPKPEAQAAPAQGESK